MIVSINLYPINIPQGTIMDSTSSLLFADVNDDEGDSPHELYIGTQFDITQQLYKLHVVENIGSMSIHRYYLTDDELKSTKQYIPIYMVIYTTSGSEVIMYRAGITYAWSRYSTQRHHDPQFVSHRLASEIISNQLDLYPTGGAELVDAWAAYRNMYCPHSSDIDNGYAFLGMPEYDPYSPYIWQHCSDLYGVMNEAHADQYDFLNQITNYLEDTNRTAFARWETPTITCDILDYQLPNAYIQIAMDMATRRDIDAPTVTISHILSGSARGRGNYTPPMAYQSAIVNVFNYDPIIIDLCVILLHCGYIELDCTYTLSTGSLHMGGAFTLQPDGLYPDSDVFNGLRYQLDRHTSNWGYNEVILDIVKTYNNVVHLSATVCSNDGEVSEQSYTIDLTAVVPLFHNLTTS